MEIVPAFGWPRNLRLHNDQVELIATLDVGPRILGYRLLEGPNVLKLFDDQLGRAGESEWMIRGGHRFWLAPEDPKLSYVPDNGPVEVSEPSAGVYRLTSPPDSDYGLQKEIDIRLDKQGSGVTIVHRARNLGPAARDLAAWALTVLAPGGIEIIPLPAKRHHPGHPSNARSGDDFAPNQAMVLWAFFDFGDDRWRFGGRYITLGLDPSRGPTKVGLAHDLEAVGYWNAGTLFVKRFEKTQPGRTYPDRGCNFETFTSGDMIEVETLGPVEHMHPGRVIEWTERWELHADVPSFDRGDEASIDEAVGRHLAAIG